MKSKTLAAFAIAVAMIVAPLAVGNAAYAEADDGGTRSAAPPAEQGAVLEDAAPAEAIPPAEEIPPAEAIPPAEEITALVVDHGEPPFPMVEVSRSLPIVDCQTREQAVDVTTTTTPFIWSDEQNGWILGAPQVEVTREITPAYEWQCAPPGVEATLATPILTDECGTENDGASVPEDSEAVSYYWASEDETNYDVYAIVNEGYVVNTIPSGWTATALTGEFIYYWSPVWTDVPCDDVETTLATPVPHDECGTENDWASVPEDSAGVSYYWASADETNFDVSGIVNEGYVVNSIPAGWTATEKDGEFIYYWSPVWTDVPCDVTPPDQPATAQPAPAAAVTPVTSLAATGSDNNLLVPIGGGVSVAMGIALMLFVAIRRVRA